MKTTVRLDDFVDAFQRADRTPSNFSFQGLHVLFDHITAQEEEFGEEWELDVISLCCSYAEATAEEIAQDYEIPLDGLNEDDAFEQVVNFLEEQGAYCGVTEEGILYRQF